jgi:tetratricopeptide (TPR) repeat protein
MRREIALVVALLPALAYAEPAGDQLRRARAALDASNYGDARALLVDALASGAYGPGEVAELYELTGVAAAALGDANAATEAFERALELAPTTTLKSGMSPKITRPFAAAEQQLAGHSLHAFARVHDGTLAIAIDDDPLAMVAGARVQNAAAPAGKAIAAARTGDDIAVPLAPGSYRVALVDAHGNRVLDLAPVAVVARVVATAPTSPPDDESPLYLRWYTYAIPTAVVFGLAAGFGVAAQNHTDNLSTVLADAPHYTYPEAQLLYNRARSDAQDANVLFAVGGVLAAATAATLVYQLVDRHHPERLAILPAPSGATVSCRLAF